MKTAALLTTIGILYSGCFFRYGSKDFQPGALGAASPTMPEGEKACLHELKKYQESHDRYSTAAEVLLFVDVAVGVATTVVASLVSKDLPGQGAVDISTAVANEGNITGVEAASITAAAVGAASAGLATAFAKVRGTRQERVEAIKKLIAIYQRDEVPDPSDLVDFCKYPSGQAWRQGSLALIPVSK